MASKLEIRRELEWRRCERDLLYFLENYWHVVVVGAGYELMNAFDYQGEDAKDFQAACEGRISSRQARLKARQLGWTTLAGGGTVWDAFFHEHHPWLIAAQSEDDASDTLSTKIKMPFSMLPKWMRDRGPNVIKENAEEIEFDNGSRIIAVPSTSSSGRGRAIFGALMDEAAFMENADELFAAIDPMCYGPLFMFSTANGVGNFFHDIWSETSLEDSEWEGKFHPWNARPGRDEEWYERTKRKYRSRPHLFYQEYPSTPEEAFLKSGRAALNMEALRENMPWAPPESRFDLSLIRADWLSDSKQDWGAMVDRARIPEHEHRDLELHVWEMPYVERDDDSFLVREPNFVISCDVSEGLEHGDYSTIVVFDANYQEEVATMKAHVPVADLADYLEFLGYWYYIALIGVERNNHGLLPLAQLQERGYPRMFRMDTVAQIRSGDRTPRYGWFTNKASKPKMVQDFNKRLADDTVAVRDTRFLHEATTFLSDGKGGYGASPGNHDDLVIAELIAVQLAQDVGTYPTIWRDPKPGPVTIGEVLELSNAFADDEAAQFGTALAGGIGQRKTGEPVRKTFTLIR